MAAEATPPQKKPSAIVVGVGSELGLGAAVARRFARENFHVFVAGRTQEKLDRVVAGVATSGGSAEAVATDATKEGDVRALFAKAFDGVAAHEAPSVVVFNAGANARIPFAEITPAQFEAYWRIGCFGGFLVGQEAARRLLPLGRGTIIFTGATGSLRGSANFAHFAVAKAGLRMISQSMAREYGPGGLHVAHIVIDGGINSEWLRELMPDFVNARGDDGLLDIDAIAETYWRIHQQPRSAWTQEMDLRPCKERF